MKEIESGVRPKIWPFTLIVMILTITAGIGLGAMLNKASAAGPADRNCDVIVHRGIYQNTENQPKGVVYAEPWGFGIEGDANTTSDGVIVALHDNGLERLTGGDSTKQVGNVTFKELKSFDHPYGEFRQTTTLIRTAADLDSPIIINLHRAGAWTPALIDTLYDAAQAHPRPEVVYFAGAISIMRDRHPDASTYFRFAGTTEAAQMVKVINRDGHEMVGLRSPQWETSTVDTVKTTGVPIASAQVNTTEKARRAQQAGINLIQGDRPSVVGNEWCQ